MIEWSGIIHCTQVRRIFFNLSLTKVPQRQEQKNSITTKILDRENALLMRQSPRWLQFFATLMMLLGCGMIAAGYLVRIDEVVTATGQLKSSGGRNDIKTPANGKIAKVYVKNGQPVKKNDLLIKFDTTLAQEKKSHSEELIKLEKTGLDKQLRSINFQKRSIKQRLETQTKTALEYKKLSEMGGIAKLSFYEAEDRVFELENQLNQLEERSRGVEIESRKRIRTLESELQNAKQQLKYQTVSASSTGVVFDLQARESGVIDSGSTILSIIPTDGLKAEIFVPNKDIGFVKVGQKAEVRIDAFPSNRYGDIDGVVKLVGADALPPNNFVNFYHFPIDIELDSNQLETNGIKIPLRSGMAITTNLVIRNKRAISIIGDFFSGQVNSIKSLRN